MSVEEPAVAEDSYPSFEWWYDLDQPFVAQPELLQGSRRYDTKLVGDRVTFDVSALLPRLPRDDGALASYLAPPHDWSATPSEPNEGWGTHYKDPLMGFVGVVVRRLAFFASIPPDDAVPADLQADWGVHLAGLDVRFEMAKWWDNVRTWLEISTGQRLTQVGHQNPPRQWGPDMRTRIWVVSEGVQPEEWVGGGWTIGAQPAPIHGVDADVFAACVALCDVEPHIAWTLLRDARALQGVGQLRRAVIDAAIAAELAVIALLDERLQNVEAKVQQVLREDNRMLGNKTRLLDRLGNGLPESFRKDLVEKRNQAVHKGVDPTLKECEAAIQAALQQVKSVFPLPESPVSGVPLVCRW